MYTLVIYTLVVYRKCMPKAMHATHAHHMYNAIAVYIIYVVYKYNNRSLFDLHSVRQI